MKLDAKPEDFKIQQLGPCEITSPLHLSKVEGDGVYDYIQKGDRILYDVSLRQLNESRDQNITPISFEKAGPMEHIFFEPSQTKVAIVTCGGLCPGLNNVIRALVMQLTYRYKAERIIGIRYGFAGFIHQYGHPIMELTPVVVDEIHTRGGTILGSSRGMQDIGEIVDTLERLSINVLFTIGGDGTLKGAHAIQQEIEKRNLKISVAGIPKTIDNDINLIDRSFGFETSCAIANDIIRDAHNEARGAYNGIALIKLMGRDAGFIVAHSALSIPEVNFVIIPEMYFELEGTHGFLEVLRQRLELKQHAVIVVAEGAGQFLFENSPQHKDASGNTKYEDIGIYLKKQITNYFDEINFPHSIKYIDPSYIIRSAPAIANDSKFCIQLAQNAVHAAMAGKTGFVVGHWNGHFTLIPIPMAVKERKCINIESELWYNVLETTGQPMHMENGKENLTQT
ncbi:MAG: ATP-dependent 6-phosphofructokinase [Bacteroidetes bacterium]|jgi:6-phosphofructokinase 1|nr:ATP-dependent 6-phosphofructokinase [Bacteroidota bacterium]